MAGHPARTGQPVLDDAKADVSAQSGNAARSAAAAVVAARYGERTAGVVMDRRPPTADQDTSLWAAWGRLRGAGCRHLVVVDSRLRPVGVLEERDLALRWPPGPSRRTASPCARWCAARPGRRRVPATTWPSSPGPCWPPAPMPFR